VSSHHFLSSNTPSNNSASSSSIPESGIPSFQAFIKVFVSYGAQLPEEMTKDIKLEPYEPGATYDFPVHNFSLAIDMLRLCAQERYLFSSSLAPSLLCSFLLPHPSSLLLMSRFFLVLNSFLKNSWIPCLFFSVNSCLITN
jgi:hypothetical protein